MDELIELAVPGGWGLALGVGVGAVLLMRRSFRPLAKGAIRGIWSPPRGPSGRLRARKRGSRTSTPRPRPSGRLSLSLRSPTLGRRPFRG